jgi:hypothetical protein
MIGLDGLEIGAPIKTSIKYGQPYYDEPVYFEHNPRPTVKAVAAAIGEKEPEKVMELIAYQMVKLNWIKPE